MSCCPPFSKDAQARRAMMFIASIQQSSFKLRRSVMASTALRLIRPCLCFEPQLLSRPSGAWLGGGGVGYKHFAPSGAGRGALSRVPSRVSEEFCPHSVPEAVDSARLNAWTN